MIFFLFFFIQAMVSETTDCTSYKAFSGVFPGAVKEDMWRQAAIF